MHLKKRVYGEGLTLSQERVVYKGLEHPLEPGLYPEGNREPLRNLSGGWGMLRFEGQFHSETKQKGESAPSAKKQRRSSPQLLPRKLY